MTLTVLTTYINYIIFLRARRNSGHHGARDAGGRHGEGGAQGERRPLGRHLGGRLIHGLPGEHGRPARHADIQTVGSTC